jgi:drug/metabolite transporter (DMT)-like permease
VTVAGPTHARNARTHVHARPCPLIYVRRIGSRATRSAHHSTFLTATFGYWAQLLVAGVMMWLRRGYAGRGAAGDSPWTRPAVLALVGSSLASGMAQALDYTAQLSGGYMLYTILHSSVTFFACVIAVCVLRARVTPVQYAGVFCVVAGLLATSLPSPIDARRSFFVGAVTSTLGAPTHPHVPTSARMAALT